MKRIVLFCFVLIAAPLLLLPGARQHAAQRAKPIAQPAKGGRRISNRFLMRRENILNPHQGIYDQADRIAEISRSTSTVAAMLPEQQSESSVKKSTANTPIKVGTLEETSIIDQEIFNTMAKRGIAPAEPATDEEFCRRVSLDITGRQPSPERLLNYINSSDPEKKDKLIGELIGSEAYIDYWTQWLGDLTRNFANAANRCDRNAEYLYLRAAVAENRPFNKIATDLITYSGPYCNGPGGFVARPAFSTETEQDYYDDLAAETARTFLGTQAICVSCHAGEGHLERVNLYLSQKTRQQFWGLAAFFAQTAISIPEDDEDFQRLSIENNPDGMYDATTRYGMRPPRNGGVIEPSYELFGAGGPSQGEDGRAALARLITSDPQFSRALVNRVFARFFTLGLVEPLDGFDLARLNPKNPPTSESGWELQPSHPVLLERLAGFFQQSGYDLRVLIKLIASSRAYALSSRYDETIWRPEYTRLYARKLARRLDAEELLDAITSATAVPARYVVTGFDKPFSSAMALPGPDEPSYDDTASDDAYNVSRFLQDFGRGDRNTMPRASNGSIPQALHMFNSDLIISRIQSDEGLTGRMDGALQQGALSPAEAATALYLNTIARQPSAAELDRVKGLISQGRQTLADLQWALFNRLDFLYNY